jgi:hypothetical protein
MTPVALFIFNRPHLTAEVYERVRAARPSRLLVVADGPRPTRPEDVRLSEATRKIVTSPDWQCELLTNFAEENLGARRRILSGLDWVFDLCLEAIILEDDCVPCPSFFSFCSSMLSHYRDDTRIMHLPEITSRAAGGGATEATFLRDIRTPGVGLAGEGRGATMTSAWHSGQALEPMATLPETLKPTLDETARGRDSCCC